MHIALVGNYPTGVGPLIGGPQAAMAYLVEGLRKISRVRLSVVSVQRNIKEIKRIRRMGVDITYIPHSDLPFEIEFYRLRRIINLELNAIRPDIVHAQNAHLYGASCVRSIFPCVVTIHNIPGSEAKFAKDYTEYLRLMLHEKITGEVVLRNAKHIVSINAYIERALSQRDVRASLYQICNPVSDLFFAEPVASSVHRRLLFVGRLRRRKRPELMIHAFLRARERVQDISLTFAGGCVDKVLESELIELVRKYNLVDCVNFLGDVGDNELIYAYSEAAVVVLPSDLETSPMAIQQAMAFGRPVICTNVGGIADLLQNGESGTLVNAGSADQLAEAILGVFSNPERTETYTQRAKVQAMAFFRQDVVAEQTVRMYQQIVSAA